MPAFFLMQQKSFFFVFKTDKKILQIYKNIKQEDAKSFLKTFRVYIKDVELECNSDDVIRSSCVGCWLAGNILVHVRFQ